MYLVIFLLCVFWGVFWFAFIKRMMLVEAARKIKEQDALLAAADRAERLERLAMKSRGEV